MTWATETNTDITTTAGTTYYALPTNLIVISRVLSHQLGVVPETTLIKLDGTSPLWPLQTGIIQNYFIERPKFNGTDLLGVYPFPLNGASTTTLTVNYYNQPATLSASSDVPFDGRPFLTPYHDLLIYYTAGVVYTVEGETDKAKGYIDLYTTRLQVMYQAIGKRPNYTPSFSGPANSR